MSRRRRKLARRRRAMLANQDLRRVDLHMHSNLSDGLLAPAELLKKCVAGGLDIISITDHDMVPCLRTGVYNIDNKTIRAIAGIEFSAKHEGKEIHILAEFFCVSSFGYSMNSTPSLALSYFDKLRNFLSSTIVTLRDGSSIDLQVGLTHFIANAVETHDRQRKIMFIGNGGSAGICSHLAIDFSKNGGLRSLAFNDGAALTCLGNDYGYEHVFEKQIEFHAQPGDLLVAISSSGRSKNILRAVSKAHERECFIVTFSGFGADNPLRTMGDFNFYLPSGEYGFVEVGHLALCHAALDLRSDLLGCRK